MKSIVLTDVPDSDIDDGILKVMERWRNYMLTRSSVPLFVVTAEGDGFRLMTCEFLAGDNVTTIENAKRIMKVMAEYEVVAADLSVMPKVKQ